MLASAAKARRSLHRILPRYSQRQTTDVAPRWGRVRWLKATAISSPLQLASGSRSRGRDRLVSKCALIDYELSTMTGSPLRRLQELGAWRRFGVGWLGRGG